jgi:hypothetical protein
MKKLMLLAALAAAGVDQAFTAQAAVKDTVILIEAETGILSEGAMESNVAGFRGTGFANPANRTGSFLELSFSLPFAGVWGLSFRYGNGSGINRPCEIRVNGAVIRNSMDFPSTVTWDNWKFSDSFSASLSAAAAHVLRITGSASGGPPNLDELKLTYSAAQGKGTLEVTLWAAGPRGWGDEKEWSLDIFDAQGQLYRRNDAFTGVTMEYSTCQLPEMPPGDYRVYGSSRFSGYWLPTFNSAWIGEYYDNAADISNAAWVKIKVGEIKRISFTLDWTTFITVATDPRPFKFTVDGAPYTAPLTFRWRQSDVHSIGVDEYVEVSEPAGARAYFREWRHGGGRIRTYTVPAPRFGLSADSLIARFEYRWRLNVLSSDTTRGTVDVSPKGIWQVKDSIVTLTAIPEKGVLFLGWRSASGALVDTARILSVRMDTSKTLIAGFGAASALGPGPGAGKAPRLSVFELFPNYPNPFNPVTEIRFDVSGPGKVTVEIFSLTGKRLKILADGEYGPGRYSVNWDGTGPQGRALGSGIYLCRMTAGGFVKTVRMSLIK